MGNHGTSANRSSHAEVVGVVVVVEVGAFSIRLYIQ